MSPRSEETEAQTGEGYRQERIEPSSLPGGEGGSAVSLSLSRWEPVTY